MASELTAHLRPHPSTPPGAMRAITAAVRRAADGRLRLRFRLDADPLQLRLPARAPGAGQFVIGLWQHTCCEAFLAAADGGEAYHELNLSPSGDWAAFAFSRYREFGALDVERCAPRISARVGMQAVELEAEVDPAALSPAYAGAPLSLGLSAVVEAADGELSYWSLAHPPGSPDFHHHSTRTLHLPAPRGGDG